METSLGSEVISEHHNPHRTIRRLIAALVAITLIVAVLSIIVELVLGFVAGPLLFAMAVFTAILLIPLLMRSVLHPEIEITANGLTLHPMIWKAQAVAWEALVGKVDHPLIFNDDATGRLLHGKNYRPREGSVIVVNDSAGLLPFYRIIGGVAGAGNHPAFAISSTTHADYETLYKAILDHVTIEENED